MSYILQNLIIALNDGASYALIALGYTMVYGVLRLINFAHGDVFMIGAFVGAYAARWMNPPTDANPSPDQMIWQAFVGMLIAMVVCGVIGYLIERLAYRPLRKAPKLSALITAIGVSLLIEYLAQIKWTIGGRSFFGPDPVRYQPIHHSGKEIAFFQKHLAISVVPKDLIVLASTTITLVALYVLVKHTRMGKAMRAVSQNADAARLMGINIDRTISFTFVLGSMLAAIGGCLWGLNRNQCTPLMGLIPGLKAFVAAVIGGIGNIPGAAVGGLILGLIETFVSSIQYHNAAVLSPYKDAIAFIILILVLLVKPEGIFGKAVPEKV
ncbi:MAG: branched-chain amino acid ABC transporter permease [Phycisphaerae bacterium]